MLIMGMLSPFFSWFLYGKKQCCIKGHDLQKRYDLFKILSDSVSKKCDALKIDQHIRQKTRADHVSAPGCPDGTHSSMQALLFEACKNIEIDTTFWNQELKVSLSVFSKTLNPLPDMPILGSSSSAAKKEK